MTIHRVDALPPWAYPTPEILHSAPVTEASPFWLPGLRKSPFAQQLPNGEELPRLVIDRYVLDQHVFGKGAFGCVLRGHDMFSSEPVAIKSLGSSGRGKEVANEVRALLRMAGARHVIGFRGCVGADPQLLIMDAGTGGDLFELVSRKRDGRLSEAEARPIAMQVWRVDPCSGPLPRPVVEAHAGSAHNPARLRESLGPPRREGRRLLSKCVSTCFPLFF